MKHVYFLALVSMLVASLDSAPVSYKGSVYDLELVFYEKPIQIKYCKMICDEDAPFWWEAYHALKNYKEYDSYDSWIKYFSKEYIEEFEIQEDLFHEIKVQQQSELSMIPKRSALYGVIFRFDGREIFILKMHDSIVEEFSGDFTSLEGFSVTQVFERVDGIWKNQVPLRIGEPFNFPYNDINLLNQLIRAGKAKFDEASGVVIPLLTEELRSATDTAINF